MTFELLKIQTDNLNKPLDSQCKLINSFNDYERLGLNVENIVVDNRFFETNTLLLLVFFDGSVPKRTILDVTDDDQGIHIVTNKKNITFSSMDYRMHLFLIKIPKTQNKNIRYS